MNPLKLKLQNLSRRDKRALGSLGIIGGIILMVFAVILPFYDAQAGIQNELRQKEELLERYVQMAQEEEICLTELAQLDTVVNWHRERLMDGQRASMATIQLEEEVRSMAADNGIQVARSNPLQERQIGDNYVKITLQINLRSDMSQLANFLYALSAHPKFFLVENFFLNSFRSKEEVRIQPRMNVSGFIRLS